KGPIQRVRGANCSRFTKTWSPIRSVSSIELEGISKACRTNVMMNRPVTSTAASEARNSTVVSRGFSGCAVLSFLANFRFPRMFCQLTYQPECPIPASHLQEMRNRVSEMVEFITQRRRRRQITVGRTNGPVNEQRPADNVFPRDKSPIPAVGAVVPVVSHHEVVSLGHNQLSVFDKLWHLQPPVRVNARVQNI